MPDDQPQEADPGPPWDMTFSDKQPEFEVVTTDWVELRVSPSEDRTVRITGTKESCVVSHGKAKVPAPTVRIEDKGTTQSVELLGGKTTAGTHIKLEETPAGRTITITSGPPGAGPLIKLSDGPMQSIELKVGQSSIVVDQKGVTIQGMMVTFKGLAMAELKAPITKVSGDGMVMMKGGIVMIN